MQNTPNKKQVEIIGQRKCKHVYIVNLATNTKSTNHVPIFPFDNNSKNANDIITNEKDFPDTEEAIKNGQ